MNDQQKAEFNRKWKAEHPMLGVEEWEALSSEERNGVFDDMQRFVDKMRERKNGSWVVRLTAKVEKEVVVVNCTEDEAWQNPFDHAVDEQEISQIDWQVNSVSPNE